MTKTWTEVLSDERIRKEAVEVGSDLGAVFIGIFVVKRKLRKLGYSKKEVYVLSTLFTTLFWSRLHLNGIRRELRRKRLSEVSK